VHHIHEDSHFDHNIMKGQWSLIHAKELGTGLGIEVNVRM